MLIYCICTQYLVGAPFALITASIAGFQSSEYDDARRQGDFRWRAGSKHGECVYGGNQFDTCRCLVGSSSDSVTFVIKPAK